MSDKKRNVTGSYPAGGKKPVKKNPTGSYSGEKRLFADYLKEEEPISVQEEVQKEAPSAPKKKKARLNRTFWKDLLNKYWKTLVYYTCILVASVALAAWICDIGNEVLGLVRPDKEYTVTIGENSSTETIADTLKEAGVIDHPVVFRLYCKLKKADGKFQFGEYTLNSKRDYNQLISALKRAPSNKSSVSFVINAGDTQEDIVTTLCDTLKFFEREELEDVLQNYDFSDYTFLKNLPKRNYRLEGYLCPGTYEAYEGESALAVVQRLLDAFQAQMLTEENQQKIASSGYSLDQLITLASILQKEGGNAPAKEAGVYFNRLKNQAFPYLQSTATVAYILPAGSVVSGSDIKTTDPYNTYRVAGLPSGPIANPTPEMFGAVLAPETTDAQYFAVQADGKTLFAVTQAEHLKNIKLTGEGARGTGTIL